MKSVWKVSGSLCYRLDLETGCNCDEIRVHQSGGDRHNDAELNEAAESLCSLLDSREDYDNDE